MKRILLGLVTIVGAASAMYVGATGAFFSDTETSTGNTFAAGAIDLKIDNESYYNGNVCALNEEQEWVWQGQALFPVPGTPCTTSWSLDDLTGHLFFDFNDIKPDDEGEDTISIHVQNDAWMCMNIALNTNDDNSTTEPEGLVDPAAGDAESNFWDGELAQNVEMVWWADDGDNVLETNEPILIQPGTLASFLGGGQAPGTTTIVLADSQTNAWGEPAGTPVPAAVDENDAVYIAKAWCFGDIATSPVTAGEGVNPSVASGITCNGANLDNSTQTDSAKLDVSFEAVQARNNPTFTCERPPVFTQCSAPTLAYADSVVSSSQGVRKNGSPVTADRSNSSFALGAPQSLGTPFDNPVVPNSFFSLGFKNNGATPGGEIVVEFLDNIIVDGPGNDLKVWEVTGGTSYPTEKVKIEVSQDGINWAPVVSSLDRDAEADLAGSGLAWAKFARITDVSTWADFEPTADGYDLDAFSALNCAEPLAD